ncbi:poly(3-hydroxyalkanoate) synthetase [Burkholderia sp. Ch1-1]|nr:poly(3-hydroxyalkanoate) synthetase [Burkholderia sp. Ch1-1]
MSETRPTTTQVPRKQSGPATRLPHRTEERTIAEPLARALSNPFREPLDYLRDVCERSVLFWDTLRQRADNMIAHERAGKPPLLDFDYEMLLDARRFDHPANYALVRITRVGDVFRRMLRRDEAACDRCRSARRVWAWHRWLQARFGRRHGDARRSYGLFRHFFPEPCPGQTLADVLHSLRRFADEVARRHPGKPPVLYGNCQAGWVIVLLSADCEGLVGPAVLNGSPLSYWAGGPGVNPMRIAGGLVGGAGLTHLLADLGDGRFDGAWLAANFENLKPEMVWEKYANLFTRIDTERERFLDFERWWNGFHFLSREEIVAIVENLFVGNRLEEGKFRVCAGCAADLRRIRNPLVIFASYGDNITPPQQALGWIPAVFKDDAELRAADQRIVYLTNPHIGHLGIFVSAKVARFEHRAILESLEEIERLAPGLYEMKIDNPTGDPDCHKPQFSVRFEERQIADLKLGLHDAAFERVRQVSELNEQVYTAFVSPLIQALANPWTAAVLEWSHPMRTSRYLLSATFSPWMASIAEYARIIEKRRAPLAQHNPYIAFEQLMIEQVSEAIEGSRQWRDAAEDLVLALLYGAERPTVVSHLQ